MAKDGTNSQYIYRVEWVGKRTGWNYRLDVIPSYDDDNYSSLTVSNEAPDCLENYEYIPYSYDKYYVGLGETPSLKLDFDLTRTTANFAKVLCDPFVTFARNITFNTDDLFPCHEQFTTGNIFELYIEYVGVQSGEVLVYRGTQITSLESYSDKDKVLNVETEHIRKTIFSQIAFDDFLFLHCFYEQGTNNAVPNSTLEYYDKPIIGHLHGGSIERLLRIHWVQSDSTIYKGYFDGISSFYGGITRLNRVIEKKIRRLTAVDDYSIQTGLPTFYVQSFLNTGERHYNLSESSLKILAYLDTAEIATQTDFDLIGSRDGIIYQLKKEYTSVWDFFQDLSGCFVKKMYFDEENKALEMKNVFSEDSTTISSTALLELKPSFFSDVCGKFSISALDDHEQGADTVEVNVINTRSTDALEFAAPIHNVAALATPEKFPFSDVNTFDTGATFHDEIFRKTINLCVWYKGNLIDKNGADFLNNGTASAQDRYIHVHVTPKINISSTVSSDDFVSVYDYYPYFTDYGLQQEISLTPQNTVVAGSYYVAAKTLSELFGNRYQTKIEMDVQIDDGTFLDGSTVICPFVTPSVYLEYDFTQLEPHSGAFSVLPTKYEFVSSSIDKDEIAKVVLLSRIE